MATSADKKPWNQVQKSLLPKPSSYSTFSRKLQSETKHLEVDNQKMEEKLNAFKEYLKSQKEKRIHADKIWSGGEVNKGSLSQYAQNVLAKKKTFKKDTISNISFLKNDSSPNLLNSDKKKVLDPKPPSAPKTKSKSEILGKDLWRIPSSLGRYNNDPPQTSYAERVNSLNSFKSTKKDLTLKKENVIQSDSLLEGSYDENNSHLSFQQALQEWRGVSDSQNTEFSNNTVNVQLGSTQTNFELENRKDSLKELEKKVQELLVDDKSLSYMEKLLLSKLKDSTNEDLKLQGEDSKVQDLDYVDPILEEMPPAGFESSELNAYETSKVFQIISIKELLHDEDFMPAQVLDSDKIIVEEPLE